MFLYHVCSLKVHIKVLVTMFQVIANIPFILHISFPYPFNQVLFVTIYLIYHKYFLEFNDLSISTFVPTP